MERPLGDGGDPERFARLTSLTICYLLDDDADEIKSVGVAYPTDTGPTYRFLPARRPALHVDTEP